MKRATLSPLSFLIGVSVLVLLNVYSFNSNAQVTQIGDYVMFSGNGGTGATNPGSSGYGVYFGSSTTITGGNIGSYRLVQTTGGADLTCNIYSGGKVTLANGNHVSGRVTAQNLYPAPATGTILQAGSNAQLSGVLDVNGNIVVQSGTVTGPVHTTGTYSGPSPANPVTNAVSFPTLPAYPDTTAITSVGNGNINSSQTITPGTYGNITFNGNKTLTFNGTGTYIFNTINISGNNNFIYDFQNSSTGVLKILVRGDAIMGKISATMVNGGSAQRIYLETHGTGALSSTGINAFEISNGSGGNGTVKFLGTVNAFNAGILIGSGSGSSSFTGAMWSRTRVEVKTGVTLTWSFYSPCSPPVANAGNDVTFCSGATANLGSAPVGGNTYSWSPVTGLSDPNIANPTVTLTPQGTTIYTLTVTSGICTNMDQVLVSVNPLPVVTANAVSGCAGTSIALSGTPSGGTWSVANPYTGSSTTYTHTYTDINGCSNTSAPASITVNPLPNATISAGGSTTFCQGGSVTLTSSSGSSYLWSNGATSQSITVSASGSYSVRVTGANGCSATSTATPVTVNPLPTATISASGSTTFCQGGSVTLTSSAGTSYSWSNGATSQSITASATGSYSVTVYNASGCSATSSATSVTVNPLPNAAITPGGSTTFCQGGSVILTSSAGNSYLWSNGSTSQSITASASGNYSVRVTDANGCSATSTATSVTVNPLPSATISASGTTTFCQGGSVTLTSSAGTSYSWSNGSTSQSISVSSTGSFSVAVYDANGCSATSSATPVNVNSLPVVTLANASGCDGSSINLTGKGSPAGGSYSVANPYLGSSTWYTYAYTDGNGCTNSANASITVNPLPNVSFTGSYPDVCSNAASVSLTATPGGGTFSGTGVSGSSFSPSAAGAGSHSITYSYTDGNGCSNSASTSITVLATPSVSAGNYSSQCLNSSALTLTGSPSGGTFSGTAVSGNTFDPVTAGTGTFTITYSYSNDFCSNSASTSIIVNSLPDVHAGSDGQLDCSTHSIVLHGSSSTSGAQYNWIGSLGGHVSADGNSANATIDQHGTFTLTVTDPGTGCTASDIALVTYDPCIFPGYNPLPNGKSYEVIGSELTSLYNLGGCDNPNEDIFIIDNCQVLVDIIYEDGMRQTLYDYLIASPFNIADTVDNGGRNRIMTCFVDISDLWSLNTLNVTTSTHLINHVRPVYRPIPTTTGVAYSLGDVGQKSDVGRQGFGVDGTGIKVGVISNSYNKQPGNNALIDVLNGDLPGVGNPDGDNSPVQVIYDYPYGVASDEGRAMMQIVHDVAPKASLAFRTGYISAGNMAKGIRDLHTAGCDVGVDDITYITEPMFSDGMIAQAVNEVTAEGMTYFTAAGNYGEKSYEGIYTPAPVPSYSGIVGTAHDFGGGDIFQNISLTPGQYLMALQWEDEFYSIDAVPQGTQNDLDIYLTYDNGLTLFGFNRNNIGGDPIEVVTFTVTQNTTTNVLIARETGTSSSVHFKYVVFKVPAGGFVINEFNQGNSTIVGQANAEGAITCGAVLYSNTPPFGVTPPTKASFSSVGGTLTYGSPRNKPDLCAPNGGNTTVQLGGVNIDSDAFPNFFGTSAAAPHAAGIGALLLNAKQKFYSSSLTPSQVRSIMTSTAVDMYSPGFDYLSGYGLVDAYAALSTLAAPSPYLVSLDVPIGVTPGEGDFTLTVTCDFITTQSQIYFRDVALTTNYIDEHHLSATIPAFTGNPPIKICTPSIVPNLNDGGCSNILYFNSPVQHIVVITADSKNKKYGEKMPVFTATITVDGIPLASSGYTLTDLGLDDLTFNTPAVSTSDVGIYFIAPVADVSDVSLQEIFDYTFTNGLLTIEKMPLVITPLDKTVDFGDKIDGTTIQFNYVYDESNILPEEQDQFLTNLRGTYEPYIVKEVALIDDRDVYNSSTLSESDLENLSFLSGTRSVTNGTRSVTNNTRAVTNSEFDTTYVVDLAYQSLVQYNTDGSTATLTNDVLFLNGTRGVTNGTRSVINSGPLADGTALINGTRSVINGTRGVTNGTRGVINSEELDGVSNTNTAVIIYETDLDGVDNPDSTFQIISINGITGMTAGNHFIVPGGFMSYNFDVTYGLGHLHILPYQLVVDADDKTVEYGTAPSYSSTITGFQYDDDASTVLSGSISYGPIGQLNVGNYPITQSGISLIQPSNYYLTTTDGALQVNPAILAVTADDKSRPYGYDNPALTISYSGFKYSDDESVISPAITASTNATVSSLPGGYPITLSTGSSASNYSISLVPGILTVNAASRSCTINAPSSMPFCNSTGNSLTATADAGYNYSWTVSGTGWQITGGSGTLSITYSTGASGTSGVFTLTVTAPITNYVISSCAITIGTNCGVEYCTYGQGSWGSPGGNYCNGMNTNNLVPVLLSTSLVSGDGTRKITFGTGESSCLISKMPAGQTSSQLPNGSVSCAGASGGNYLQNSKFKSNILGQQIALELSRRYNPALGSLHITGQYLTTYNATSCSNGNAIAGSQQTYLIPATVVSYLGTNNTVLDLINLANKALGGTLGTGAPTIGEINSALTSIINAFNTCKIFGGFSSVASRDAVISDNNSNEVRNIFFYPNPASDKTTVSFVAAQGSHVILDIYDVNGSLVSRAIDRLVDEDGLYSTDVDCSSFAKGIYFMRLSVDDETSQGKLVIIK